MADEEERAPAPTAADRTAADRFADELAANACDVLRALLPPDIAAELQAIVADQLALHPDLAPIVDRARPRAAPGESGEDVRTGGEAAEGTAAERARRGRSG